MCFKCKPQDTETEICKLKGGSKSCGCTADTSFPLPGRMTSEHHQQELHHLALKNKEAVQVLALKEQEESRVSEKEAKAI